MESLIYSFIKNNNDYHSFYENDTRLKSVITVPIKTLNYVYSRSFPITCINGALESCGLNLVGSLDFG